MSKAKTAFEGSIKDAEVLLGYFDDLPRPLSDDAEVLKRAGLVMALTAWETYIEDRVLEEVSARTRVVNGSHIGKFVMRRLEEELRRLHNPTSEKVRKLFGDFLEVDVTAKWEWQGYDAPKAKKTLDDLLSKRGDVVHRSKPLVVGVPTPHVVNRADLDKTIRFLKGLVAATDKALVEE